MHISLIEGRQSSDQGQDCPRIFMGVPRCPDHRSKWEERTGKRQGRRSQVGWALTKWPADRSCYRKPRHNGQMENEAIINTLDVYKGSANLNGQLLISFRFPSPLYPAAGIAVLLLFFVPVVVRVTAWVVRKGGANPHRLVFTSLLFLSTLHTPWMGTTVGLHFPLYFSDPVYSLDSLLECLALM